MALYTELSLLREEERVLMKIASRLNDQLNRLKVCNYCYCIWGLTMQMEGESANELSIEIKGKSWSVQLIWASLISWYFLPFWSSLENYF
jgi:hypothetical protein